jgi:hypothetical protein
MISSASKLAMVMSLEDFGKGSKADVNVRSTYARFLLLMDTL